MVLEAIAILAACFAQFLLDRFFGAAGTIVLGGLLALAMAVGTHVFTRQFRQSGRRKLSHYLLCLAAAGITWFAVPVYYALGYLESAAKLSISVWKKQIQLDRSWQDRTFSRAYADIARLGTEDMQGFPAPADGGHTIPLTQPESVSRYAQRYGEDAAAHWRESRPLLGRLLWTVQAPSRARIAGDVEAHFAESPGRAYPATRAVDLAARTIEESLHRQAPDLRFWGRTLFLLIAGAAQLLPIGLAAWQAHRELRPEFHYGGTMEDAR